MEQEERTTRLNNYISSKALQGFNVVDKNESALACVLKKEGEKVNHTLHAIITFFTCGAWGIVWIIKALTREKELRIRASIDSSGNLLEETITGN